MVTTLNTVLSVLTMTAQALTVLLAGALAFRRRNALPRWLTAHALLWSFLVALAAMLGSLSYSEIAGYAPCTLCWYQRIAMYSQVVILGVALWKHDRAVLRYSLALSCVGAVIAAYHYLLQLGLVPSVGCTAIGYSVSCSQRFVLQYGYITIPLMALTAFVLNALLAAVSTSD